MARYNNNVRPVRDVRSAVDVKFHAVIIQLVNLDEKQQRLATTMDFKITWVDQFLHWHPEMFGGIEQIVLPTDAVWMPDLMVWNSVSEKFYSWYHVKLTIQYDGTIVWVPPGLVETSCDVNTRKFPFDEQKCEIRLGSWALTKDLVNIQHNKPIDSRNGIVSIKFRTKSKSTLK